MSSFLHWIQNYPTMANVVIVVVFLLGLGRVWAKNVRPIIRAVVRIDEAVPVLLDIAAEFKPNSGSTLHDRLVRIEDKIQTNTDITENIESQVDAQERMTIRVLIATAAGFKALGHDIALQLPDPNVRDGEPEPGVRAKEE